MSLYKGYKGKYRYSFQHQGKRYYKTGFATKKEALAAREAHRAQVVNGTSTEPKGSVLSSLVCEYLDANQGKLAEKTWKYKRYVFNCFLAHAGDLPLGGITSLLVNTYLQTRPSGYNANFHRKDLSALFSWGMKHGLCRHNPALRVEKFKVEKKRRVIPTPDEVARMFQTAGEYMPLLKVMFYTMGRRGEILRMRWGDVNFQKKEVTLWTRKRRSGNLESDDIPMSEELNKVLQDLYNQRTQEEWVFFNPKTGNRYMSRPRIMRTICRRAGVRPFGFHSLRHFAASYMHDVSKESMKKIQILLRHTQLRTTEAYLHRVDDGLREAVNNLPIPEEMGSVTTEGDQEEG